MSLTVHGLLIISKGHALLSRAILIGSGRILVSHRYAKCIPSFGSLVGLAPSMLCPFRILNGKPWKSSSSSSVSVKQIGYLFISCECKTTARSTLKYRCHAPSQGTACGWIQIQINPNTNPNGLLSVAALILDYNNIELLTLQLNHHHHIVYNATKAAKTS